MAGALALALCLEYHPNSPFPFSKAKKREGTVAKAEFLFDLQLLLEPSDFSNFWFAHPEQTVSSQATLSKRSVVCVRGKKTSNDKKMQTDRVTDRDEWMLCVSLVK